MANDLISLLSQLKASWAHFSVAQRFKLVVTGLALAGGILGLTMWSARPEYVPIYSKLSQAEIGEIVLELKERSVSYRLADKGTTVLVPAKQVYELRLELAAQGLPRQETGAEIFGKANLGMTDFAQRVNYRRALQSELAHTITQLEPVEWARVQIVTHEPALFVRDEKPATASAVLKLRPGHALRPSQIVGITYLISASVKGLDPQHVTITDNYGNPLSSGQHDEDVRIIGSRFDIQKQTEEHLTRKAQSMLDTILGAGNSVVRVAVSLDWQEESERKIEFSKEGRVARRESITEKTTQSGQVGGAAGSSANLGSSKSALRSPMRDSESVEDMEYEVPSTETTRVKKPGAIQHLNVAVVVKGKYQNSKGTAGSTQKKFVPLDSAELGRIEQVVKEAVGFDPNPPRSDSFAISSAEFVGSQETQAPQTAGTLDRRELVVQVARGASVAIAALAFVLLARTLVRGRGAGASGGQHQGQDEAAQLDVPVEQLTGLSDMKRNLLATVGKHPGLASNVVRSWLSQTGEDQQ